jgi:hypothetical protein
VRPAYPARPLHLVSRAPAAVPEDLARPRRVAPPEVSGVAVLAEAAGVAEDGAVAVPADGPGPDEAADSSRYLA